MAPHKTLINRTGYPLDVVLIVRKGDHPSLTAGTVNVQLPAGPDHEDMKADERSVQTVTYGNATNIYLNGLELSLEAEGATQSRRRIVAERGMDLDNALNTRRSCSRRAMRAVPRQPGNLPRCPEGAAVRKC